MVNQVLVIEARFVGTDFDDKRNPLPPPRFSLASLFWVIAVLAALFAGMHYLGSHATLLLVLFALAIFAHVAGNALGTKLRESGNRRPVRGKRPLRLWRNAKPSDFAPPTNLGVRAALGRPALIATVVGSLVSALFGGGVLILMMERMTLETIALAIGASAILGGIWTFAAASFIQVSFAAARQASRDGGEDSTTEH